MDKEKFEHAKELNKMFLKVLAIIVVVLVVAGVVYSIFFSNIYFTSIEAQINFSKYFGFGVFFILLGVISLYKYKKSKGKK